ncbi:MAG: hypothetical protein IKN55_00625 [Oscillospiraceae bacterium]|nr:hypothetical protein [Oscillospiraceae bacterium]
MKKTKQIWAAVTAFWMIAAAANPAAAPLAAGAAYGVGGNGTAVMEYLDRGIYAVKSGNGMFVSWRWNANDPDDAEFRLYRDDQLIYTSKAGDATCFQDNGGSAAAAYRVDCLSGGKVLSSETCRHSSGTNYFDIRLNSPGAQYSPNDCSVGDVDGDGQYEIFLKWDPSNSKDNSQSGVTDNVFIDCYTLEGKQLWRVDLGKNIRAGQHYTQMCVADFDGDGHAELITKTSDGTKDGKGKVIGDGSKVYRNGSGYILSGPEYLTLFDGRTGAALDTIDFPVPRGTVTKETWGDNYGNRVDRMNSGIAYLDGVHPTALYGRGYYTRLTVSAVDVKGGKLVKRWVYDTGFDRKTPGWGCGNHNMMVADSDNDGKQEVFMGASAIDDNGKLLWTTGQLHGDAMHLGDLIPDHEGLELWECHEDKPYGESCIDARTGKVIFHINNTKDTGRCAADNVWAGSKGAEFWGAADGNVYNTAGKKIGGTRPAQNFFIYWDGDLEREILDGTKISKMTDANTVKGIFTANGCGSNNSSKSVPCMTADLFGDWREELILRTDDNKSLRIWCTTSTTKVRLTTLMHDMQYRAQNACQQSAYNQPPHVSYYLGSDAPLPARPDVKVLGAEAKPVQPDPQPTEPDPQPTEPDPQPTEPAKQLEEPADPEDFIYGDVNFDGVVDIFDLALVKRQLTAGVLGRNAMRRADVDADGIVGVVDAAALQKYLHTGSYVPAYAEKTGFSYAIDQKITKGVEENTNEGFREKAYVNLDNETGSSLEWTVFAQEDGNYLCSFGIANGSAANRQMKIEVNGSKDYWMQDFLTTEAWTAWQERGIVLPLHEGKNTIRLTSAGAEGGPNFDYLRTERTDEPVAQSWTENAVQAQTVQKTEGVTVYIAGDSTVQTYRADKAPQQGWGAYLSENLPKDITVSNQAIAGRSSKSFYDNGRLDTILNTIRKDDYLLIQFSINDAGAQNPERYAPASGKVPGAEGSFEYYMAKYIEGAKEKGARPVVVTTVIGLKAYQNGRFTGSYGNYCDSVKKLAAYYQIPCIDLNSMMVEHYNQIGYDAAYKYHLISAVSGSTDMTHFTETGARAVAKLVADEMTRQGLV